MRLPSSPATKLQAAVCAAEALVCLRLGAAVGRADSVGQAVRTGATDTGAGGGHQPDPAAADLAALTYELLDAHVDTAQLAGGLPLDRSWAAHLDYLRALQRKGREMLARTAPEELSFFSRTALGSRDVR
jgi:hypothetical protein